MEDQIHKNSYSISKETRVRKGDLALPSKIFWGDSNQDSVLLT